MDKFDELLKQLNELEIEQEQMEWSENIPEEIWNEHFANKCAQLESDLDVDKHRWYETSISVVEVYDRIMGVKHVSDIFSESMSCKDCGHTLEFFEMEPVNTITYSRI